MQIIKLHTLTTSLVNDLMELMHELDPKIAVTTEMLERTAKTPIIHLFATLGDNGANHRERMVV